ncbi:hypothetical protein AB0E75_14185 [Streptomyces griseoviridis]|uniref:Uncharacterized protein n=1 Tax=Streptomyces griseoviridis TaxID=45398 RepID=A0ABT9LPQ1_STRGD|nr:MULTISPECIES: hypothetical protein [Streptomyces]MDP9685502.1 hypothetical protein [Streptomyces griseoviridis]
MTAAVLCAAIPAGVCRSAQRTAVWAWLDDLVADASRDAPHRDDVVTELGMTR